MMPSLAVVVRDGADTEVPASQLAIGDIVKLKPGDRVPADMRMIYSAGMKVCL